MDKMEKLEAMNKVLRELEDVKNSETSVLKKVAQIEAENINLGINLLDKTLPDIHEYSDKSIETIESLLNEFTAYRDKFVKDNNLAPNEEVIS
ncbi:hypothetical protein U0035_14635 [Niabella yanshanensis]|uniref:Uncharacterized protein n=1 Tax=Niabella yanshanensis TaxID=577386 RepID=A0ABZ0W144_9BACT|nr:hypothetical protein [Niabella yanshanensis]WQD36906.1 hypothetical protein U0035_14635 [Niabella yanshanensis]